MSIAGLAAALAAFASAAAAQSLPIEHIQLRGDRFRGLGYAEMTPEQRVMLDHTVNSARAVTNTTANGPFNVLLRSPEMGDIAQQFGASMRFNQSMPRKLNEMAIIITARYWTAQYEWYAHKRAALQAGLDPAIVDAIQHGRRPGAMQKDEDAVYTFCTELLNTKHVSDATFATAKNAVGEKGVVDLMGVMSWYQMVSMLLNVDRYPLPAGAQPELEPLS